MEEGLDMIFSPIDCIDLFLSFLLYSRVSIYLELWPGLTMMWVPKFSF